MILTGCVAFAEHVGPTRVESELLPQCWEQVGTLFITTIVHHCIYWLYWDSVLASVSYSIKPPQNSVQAIFIGLCISLGVGQCEHTICARKCASCKRLLVQTRMNSSRMRTVRCSGHLKGGGCLPRRGVCPGGVCPEADTPPLDPDVDTPPDI